VGILPCPGSAPTCADAEIITIGPVRHLLCRRSESGFLADKGFNGRAFTDPPCRARITNLVPPTKAERATMPRSLQKIIAEWRNRVETTFREPTDTMDLALGAPAPGACRPGAAPHQIA
jgi:hypothetical protein